MVGCVPQDLPGAVRLFSTCDWQASHDTLGLVAGGRLADSPVQARWDVQLADGSKVKVKYLANSDSRTGAWVNEHLVRSVPGVDWYALVIIEGFQVSGVAAFPAAVGQVCRALGKRHPDQESTLQFGRRNWHAIRDDPDRFRALGVRVWLPPFTPAAASQPAPIPKPSVISGDSTGRGVRTAP
jgi:hypothetical protein